MKYIFLFLYLCITTLASEINTKEVETYEVDEVVDLESKKSMQKWLDNDFGLTPYKVNYLLPVGYTSHSYKSYVPTDQYRHVEAELQISLKLHAGSNLLGLGENYYFSYTHQAFWQIYAESSPFRETTYNPELFVIFNISGSDSIFNMESIKLALAHRSNGQGNIEDNGYDRISDNPNSRSRSVNYIYSTFSFRHNTLMTELTLWVPFPENKEKSDNPDLMDYTGYTSIKFNYFLRKHMFTLMGRGNFSTLKGAAKATYSYPLFENVCLYAKVFTGYGESLTDYNNKLTKYSIGFSFSR
ncbi:MAG: phospholipase A [Campylobacterota bacterium]|nr:phospholipase A [Campylobacterota bacterium]